MKVKHYNEMMAYLTRPGFNGGGAVSNRTVLPKRKPAAEVKKRKKINYEKIKQYLGKESQELIERELGFAAGGGVNPAQLKQRFMQLVTSIQDADDAEIPSIVAQAKQIREQIDDLNRQLAPDRQIRIGAEGLQFDNPLVDAARIQEAVKPVQGIKPLEAIKSITEDNPAKALVPDFPKGDKGTLADEEEKLDPSKRVAVDPKGSVVQASMKMNTGKTFEKLKNIFKSVEPDLYPEIKTEDEFAEGGSVETPKRGLVDGPGSYSNKDTYAGQPTKLYSSLKDAVTPERYKQIKFANPEMSEKQLEKSYKKLTRSQKYDLISLQKGGGYKNRSGMINPTKSKISEYSGRVKTLKNFKIVEEAGTINPKTKKPFTLEEFLNASPATRRYYLKLASDPIGFRAEIAAQNLKRRDEGKIKVKGYNLTPNALRGERNGLLRFLRTAADEGNPNYELVKRKGEIIGVKDKKAGVVYRSAIFTKPYSEKNHVSIHEHPDYRKVHNPYYKTQGGRPGLFELAKEFKFTSPNTTLGTYFAKYGEVPSYSDMYNFLTRGPESAAFRKQYNALEKHHVSLVKGSPTKNIQLTLHDKNRQAEVLLKSYDDPNSPYYKNQNYMDRELKKINARLKVGNKILGGAPLTGEKALAAAKRETVRLFKERLTENPKIVDDLMKAVNSLPKSSQIVLCRKLNVKSVGDLVKDCPTMIAENPTKTLNAVEGEAKKLPKQDGDRLLKAAANIRQGLKVTGLGLLAEVPAELAVGVNPFKRGKPVDEIVDESILGLYGIGRDLNRPNIEEFVNTTQRAGALKFYDYYKDQNRLNEIDTTLRRLSVDQPDADTSDLLQEKELIQGRLGTEPTDQDAEDFSIFLKRRAGEFEANKKARGQYGPFTNIIQGTTPQSFSDAAEELNIDLGGMLSDLVLPERENIVPTTTRAERRDRDFMRRRAEGIQRLEQNILFPATDSSFAGGGIAKQAGVESGIAPESGPTPDGPKGLFSAIKYAKKR